MSGDTLAELARLQREHKANRLYAKRLLSARDAALVSARDRHSLAEVAAALSVPPARASSLVANARRRLGLPGLGTGNHPRSNLR